MPSHLRTTMPPSNPINKRLEEFARRRRLPGATYRLQLNRYFTFEQALGILDYLRDLGISDIYASPLFQAGPESTHGYDICCFELVSASLGGREGLDRLAAGLRERDMGLLLDMVPNHMGNDQSNAWWLDVLEKGRRSQFAAFFDIDWRPIKSDLRDRVLLPVLEDHYARVLESGKLRLEFAEGGFFITYYDRRFPVAVESYATLLGEILADWPGEDQARTAVGNLRALIQTLRPAKHRAASNRLEFSKVKEQLEQWRQTSGEFRQALGQMLQTYQGAPGKAPSFNKLHTLLQAQHYRLAWWKVGPEEINYRRFFDITELVSLRMELPEVFRASHELVFQLLQEGKVTGLRIDHPDGLWDPREYFERLQARWLRLQFGRPRGKKAQALQAAIAAWLRDQSALRAQVNPQPPPALPPSSTLHPPSSPRPSPPLYLLAEKILTGGESLPADWLIEGTTGYDFLQRVNGIFVQTTHREAFDRIYGQFGGELDWSALVYAGKKRILDRSLISELKALTHRLQEIALATRYGLDFSCGQLQAGLAEVIATFPVYRTYLTLASTAPSPQELHHIVQAVQQARERNPRFDPAVFDFIQNLLLLQFPEDLDAPARALARAWVMKFQQLTGPVMAKGLEDTAFYNFNRLVSLNEVGGNPGEFGVTVEQFHQYNTAQARRWPHALLATATHDTKRGEDVRARLNVLSEMPGEWERAVQRWRQLNASKKARVDGQPAPHPNDEYLLYQTLVGAWPFRDGAVRGPETERAALETLRDRVAAYLLKAIKEAKARTSWTEPNPAYEDAMRQFIHALFDPSPTNEFQREFIPFQQRVAHFGQFNSLAQVLLKMTSPGVPDFYQGTELWDLALVDPDNRRPVDYGHRRDLLSRLQKHLPAREQDWPPFLKWLWQESPAGMVKLFVMARALHFRREHRLLFDFGEYLPLAAEGARREHLVAFARRLEDAALVAAAPRLVFGLLQGREQMPVGAEVWQDTWLSLPFIRPGARCRNIFTRERVPVAEQAGAPGCAAADVFATFPLALLEIDPHG